MSAAKAIYTRLTATVSPVKVFASDVANNTSFPRVVYTVNDSDRPNTYGGNSGLQKCSVDVECQAETYSGADTLASSVLAALDNGRGVWGGVNVQGCWYRGSVERHDEPLPGVAHDTYTQSMTFDLWIKE